MAEEGMELLVEVSIAAAVICGWSGLSECLRRVGLSLKHTLSAASVDPVDPADMRNLQRLHASDQPSSWL